MLRESESCPSDTYYRVAASPTNQLAAPCYLNRVGFVPAEGRGMDL